MAFPFKLTEPDKGGTTETDKDLFRTKFAIRESESFSVKEAFGLNVSGKILSLLSDQYEKE